MTRGLKILTVLALIAVSGVATQALYANCQEQAVYEVLQCANSTWFAPPPAGTGPISGYWWAVGFGNNTAVQTPTLSAPGGSGWVNPGTTVNGLFIGIDSGTLPAVAGTAAVTLDLVDATTITGIGAPVGSMCFSSRANWGSPGIDSCVDINRSDSATGGLTDTPGQSDGYVNKYWNNAIGDYSPYYYNGSNYYLNHQLDPPMGVLLTEGSGRYFAAAFFASAPKISPKNQTFDSGNYAMGEIRNGLPNAGGQPNVVPWQLIPNPVASAVIVTPSDPNSVRNLSLDWSATAPVVISDNSHRPCLRSDMVTPCGAALPAPFTYAGVGVNDQGPLIHYEVEMTTMDLTGACGTTWTLVAGTKADHPATTAVANGIPPQSCVRLKTTFGKTPVAAFVAAPVSAANRTANANRSEQGQLGDIGFSVTAAPVKVGGPLVSQNASLKAVEKKQGSVHVVFSTDAELNVRSFDVVGIDSKGGSKVIGSVACKQCTSGLGSSYDELISGTKLQGAKSIQIVIQPSGVRSNTLSLK